jgi:hypothetical protein
MVTKVLLGGMEFVIGSMDRRFPADFQLVPLIQ